MTLPGGIPGQPRRTRRRTLGQAASDLSIGYLPLHAALRRCILADLSDHDVLSRKVVAQHPKRKPIQEFRFWSFFRAGQHSLSDDEVRTVQELDGAFFDEEPQVRTIQNSSIPVSEATVKEQRQSHAQMRNVRERNDNASS